jgi:hypothetical protein
VLKGLKEVRAGELARPERVRRPGAGRPRAEVRLPDLRKRVRALLEPVSRGDPEPPLLWSAKSTRALAAELRRECRKGLSVGRTVVGGMLHAMGYGLQATRKTKEGGNWRGKPLESRAAIVNLIAATKTSAGLKVYCELEAADGTAARGAQLSRRRAATFSDGRRRRPVPEGHAEFRDGAV